MHSLTLERLRKLPVRQTDEAWEIAIVTLPTEVQERRDRKPWHPTTAACASTLGVMAMSEMAKPGELPPSCALDAVAAMAFGSGPTMRGTEALSYLPSRVHIHVLPPAIKDSFTAAMRELGVRVEVKTRLPHIQEFVEGMREHFAEREADGIDAPPLMKVKGMTVERIRAFAEAGVQFWKAAPWRLLTGDVAWEILPRPKTPALRACVVMGGGGAEFGIMFLASALDLYGIHIRAALGTPALPSHRTQWAISFERLTCAPDEDAILWHDERLPLADPDGMPVPVGITEAGRVMRPAPDQLTLMEGVLRLFASMTAADAGGEGFERVFDTFDGPMTLGLRCGARPFGNDVPPDASPGIGLR